MQSSSLSPYVGASMRHPHLREAFLTSVTAPSLPGRPPEDFVPIYESSIKKSHLSIED
jgi:hypothetical protein